MSAIASTKTVVEEFKLALKQLYGSRLKGLILYGSWARNEATTESDIDLLVVLDGNVIPGREIDRMIDIIVDINLKYAVLLAVYPISEKSYIMQNSPLLLNVRKEGVPA